MKVEQMEYLRKMLKKEKENILTIYIAKNVFEELETVVSDTGFTEEEIVNYLLDQYIKNIGDPNE